MLEILGFSMATDFKGKFSVMAPCTALLLWRQTSDQLIFHHLECHSHFWKANRLTKTKQDELCHVKAEFHPYHLWVLEDSFRVTHLSMTPSGGSNHVGGQAQITGYPAKVIGFYSRTIPGTNIAPEKGCLEDYYLSVPTFRCSILIICKLMTKCKVMKRTTLNCMIMQNGTNMMEHLRYSKTTYHSMLSELDFESDVA